MRASLVEKRRFWPYLRSATIGQSADVGCGSQPHNEGECANVTKEPGLESSRGRKTDRLRWIGLQGKSPCGSRAAVPASVRPKCPDTHERLALCAAERPGLPFLPSVCASSSEGNFPKRIGLREPSVEISPFN